MAITSSPLKIDHNTRGGSGRRQAAPVPTPQMSPPNPTDTKDNNHYRSERHHHHHHHRSPFPQRPPTRRSLTPPTRDPPRRSRSRGRASPERRDHGKQLRSRAGPFTEDGGYSFLNTHKYMSDLAHPRSKLETEFRHQGGTTLPSASLGLRRQGLLTQRSILMDDGAARKYYTVPTDTTGYLSSATAVLKSENVGVSGFYGYHDPLRDPYDERDKEKIHTKDTSFPLISSTRGRAFGGTSSSSLAKDGLLELYRDHPHHSSDGFSRGFGVSKLPDDPLERRSFGMSNLLDDPLERRGFGVSKLPDDPLKRWSFGTSKLSDDPLERKGFGVSKLSDDPLECRGFGVTKLPDDPLERHGYVQGLISDPSRHAPLSTTARHAPRDYMYYDLDRSKMNDQGFLSADNAYKKAESGNRGDFRSTSFMDLAGDGVDRADPLNKNSTESSLWNGHHSLHGDAALDYHDVGAFREDYVRGFGSGRDASRVKSSRDNEVAPFEDRYALTREGAPMAYRERPRSPLLSDRRLDMYRRGASPSNRVSHKDNIDVYDHSPERMVRGKYGMDDDASQIDLRDMFPNDRSAFRRLRSPSGSDEMRTIEDRLEFPPSKRPAYGQRQRRMRANRMPRSDARIQYGDSSAHAGHDRGISLKRRLRPGPSEFHGSFPYERRNDFSKPYKFWKKDVDYHHANQRAQHEDTFDDPPPVLKTDPPAGSEDFKHQVQKAFLRYSKVLNENSQQQKRYLKQGKAGSLFCCVCGSLSKKFMDTHSLVTHTYNSLKVGLKTEHRGLHKALCTLMGWNWLVPPDTAKIYQSCPVAEAETLKEDLILWPPVVIIHNSSIGNKTNTIGAKVMTTEGMKEILRDMEFEAEKIQVGQGKPANQSVLLIKFMPTFSGLQEAQRLHKHYVDSNCGRQEFHQITSTDSDDKVKEDHAENTGELLYGYMAVAEDLDKLDPGTKKRCLVKSRKDIEAIADAPLNMD